MKRFGLLSSVMAAMLFVMLGSTTLSADGKCGASKCGGDKKEKPAKKCGSSKCGGEKAKPAMKCGSGGKCGGEKKEAPKSSGKCGQGKCG